MTVQHILLILVHKWAKLAIIHLEQKWVEVGYTTKEENHSIIFIFHSFMPTATTSTTTTIHDLPGEIIDMFFSFVTEIELLKVSRVCKMWNEIITSCSLGKTGQASRRKFEATSVITITRILPQRCSGGRSDG